MYLFYWKLLIISDCINEPCHTVTSPKMLAIVIQGSQHQGKLGKVGKIFSSGKSGKVREFQFFCPRSNGSHRRAQKDRHTNPQMDRQTEGHYQVHYLSH